MDMNKLDVDDEKTCCGWLFLLQRTTHRSNLGLLSSWFFLLPTLDPPKIRYIIYRFYLRLIGLLSWFFLHWILLLIMNPMSTCLEIVHGNVKYYLEVLLQMAAHISINVQDSSCRTIHGF